MRESELFRNPVIRGAKIDGKKQRIGDPERERIEPSFKHIKWSRGFLYVRRGQCIMRPLSNVRQSGWYLLELLNNAPPQYSTRGPRNWGFGNSQSRPHTITSTMARVHV